MNAETDGNNISGCQGTARQHAVSPGDLGIVAYCTAVIIKHGQLISKHKLKSSLAS
jgi:hypothetical protein